MQADIPYHLENFIGGNFIGPLSGRFIDNIDPATGKMTGHIPDSNAKDVDAAVMASEKIFQQWSNTTVDERFRILNKIADLIDENMEALANAESTDNGKPL